MLYTFHRDVQIGHFILWNARYFWQALSHYLYPRDFKYRVQPHQYVKVDGPMERLIKIYDTARAKCVPGAVPGVQ